MRGVGELSRTLTAGHYRLVRPLGGDDGRVHEARHERLGGRFALKVFGEVEARAFQRAAQQASTLRHPGIVQVVDYGAATGGAFVVMEWVEGRSLAAQLASGGALAPDAVARIVDSVALGLQAAHRQGLVHGHLAPERVLLLAPGRDESDATPGLERTKIVGLGLDRIDALSPGLDVTEVTPYTAPEQLSSDASPLADQYALGAIAYELLTGVPPAGDAAARTPPRSVREYDPTIDVIVDDVVQRALSPDPGARWADVYTFARRLREATAWDGGRQQGEERTRLAPLPLTVSRPTRTALPLELPPIVLPPMVASIDVDLKTPGPHRLELPLQGEIFMSSSPSRPPQSPRGPSPFPGPFPAPRPTSRATGQPHYGIQPTPTFSFSDEAPPSLSQRRRSGGGLGLALVVLAAGAGGYFTVQTHSWQDVEPLLARAKQLVHSLSALAPGASPEPAPPPSPAPGVVTAPTITPTGAPAQAVAAPGAAAPALHPEVVPIAPATTAAATSRAKHEPQHAGAHHKRPAQQGKDTFDEAAAEDDLLGAPVGGR